MSLQTGKTIVKASMTAQDQKTVTGFTPAKQSPELSFSAAPNTSVYGSCLTEYGTLAANANVTIDLYSYTTDLGESVTATKLSGFLIKAAPANTSALGAILKIAPGASNPALLFMSGTSPAVSLPVNTNGAAYFVMSGSHEVLNTTQRNVILENTGSNSLAYSVFVLTGA